MKEELYNNMLFDEKVLVELENHIKQEKYEEYVSRAGKYPSFNIISEKPVFAEGNYLIQDVPKSKIDSRISAFQQYDRVCYDHVGASYWVLDKIAKENAHVKHSLHVIASSCASTVPLFQITDRNNKQSRKISDLTELLMFPNLNEHGYSLLYKTFKSLAKVGNAYWQVIKQKNGDIHSLYYLPANTLRAVPFINSDNGQLEFCYIQTNYLTNKVDKVYFQDEIIHFKMPNENSIVYGESQLVALFKDISFDEEAKNYIISWFQEAFSGGQIFKQPNSSKDVVRRNRQEMSEKFTGTNNAGRAMILEGDMALVYDGNKARDIDFSNLKNISKENIYTCLSVPLSLAGIRVKEGSGNAEIINSEEKAMIRNTIQHYCKIVYETINLRLFRYILDNKNLTIKAGVTQLFNNSTSQTLVANASKYCGTSINENREMIGLPPVQDAQNNDRYNSPIIATNNGLAPLEAVFDQIEGNPATAFAPNRSPLDKQQTPTLAISHETGKNQLT